MPRWLFWTLLTLLSWGIWAVLSRLIGDHISPAGTQAMSTLGLLPIIAALALAKEPDPAGHRRRGIALAFGSGIVSSLGNIAYFAALNDAKAATIVPLTSLYPAVTILLAVPLLKERVTAIQWIGIACSLASIYLFNFAEDQLGMSPGIVSALVAIVLWGVAMLLQKLSTDQISARLSALWFLAAFVPVAALILVREPLPSAITPREWALAAAIGFTLGFGNLTILRAFASGGEAAVIAPLSGLYPVVSIPIAIAAFGERLNWREGAGIALALLAVVLLSSTPASTVSGATGLEQE